MRSARADQLAAEVRTVIRELAPQSPMYRIFTMETLAAKWNGTTWDIATTPNGSLTQTRLTGLAALSATDLYAVGYTADESFTAPQSQTFVLHYNGRRWTTENVVLP